MESAIKRIIYYKLSRDNIRESGYVEMWQNDKSVEAEGDWKILRS